MTSVRADELPGQHSLAVRGLSVRFGGLAALDGVTLHVDEGEVVGLIGPNGAGKTTLFNAVCGLVRPSGGTIAVHGVPLVPDPARLAGQGVARTLQGLGLFRGLSVRENVLAGNLGADDPGAAAQRQLVALDLAGHADRPVGDLPYPEQKKVALARAMVAEPRLLLLDEPAGGLGSDDIAALADLVRHTAATGCAVLLVEHHVDFVMGVCDRVVVLDFGRVIAAGTPDEVAGDPAVDEAYLGIEVPA
ncbi:ABC transporter ATP-binding protein [Cellulomonas sp. zg-ZUI188]|uniref:ABC transporter ATP-binding protein n=2 Tax=Cellulomonas fengjieae TaxID=2819978 RepID=A0ABS3SD27_9CELL|nr:ABC transporter ATP-binding protein [Cellulomonas fengjieae]QVI67961.1 ABC transporter ATP-binding protein [Cellulomonas fengjieae]